MLNTIELSCGGGRMVVGLAKGWGRCDRHQMASLPTGAFFISLPFGSFFCSAPCTSAGVVKSTPALPLFVRLMCSRPSTGMVVTLQGRTPPGFADALAQMVLCSQGRCHAQCGLCHPLGNWRALLFCAIYSGAKIASWMT